MPVVDRGIVNTAEPASPPFPPRTPDTAFSLLPGRSASFGMRCFCGNSLGPKRQSGMFCSKDCAHKGTFSSLTHTNRLPSTGALAEPFQDTVRMPTATSDFFDESSPHPRAMARADQRREERRRRRADPMDVGHTPLISRSSTCPNMPTSTGTTAAGGGSGSPTLMPDLISSHSRNTSSTSSIFSLASGSALSRNGSICSTHHRQPSSVAIGAAIMEVDGEGDAGERALARSTYKARPRRRNHSSRSAVSSLSSSSSNLHVHDMLDELINMEQSFQLVDDPTEAGSDDVPERIPTPVFVPLQYPPRTPSPVNSGRAAVPPAPPGGTGRRNSLVDSRPSSTILHQSSLSESHTALYLATASPLKSSTNDRNRRSASPQLSIRRSMVFTPSQAGPSIANTPSRYESPSRRKPSTPSAHRPVMTSWRFPKNGEEDDYDMPEPSDLLWPQQTRTVSFPTSQASMNLAQLASSNLPPRSGLLSMLMDEDDIDMETEVSDDRSTVRGSIRQSMVAPAPPFAQRGW